MSNFGSLWMVLGLAVASIVRADEGMWLFDQPPSQVLRERYGFEPSEAWLRHLQRSCVRFNSGGSGSFVSEDGLLISNHHVGSDALYKLSSSGTNFLRDGFHARSREQEIPCLDLELNVLQEIEDVTARVNAAVPRDATAEAAHEARRKVIATIEKESLDRTGMRSDVVTLWKGGAYHLYRYKRYTDVRLVFAPEQQIAAFGGDPDNFEFPRFDLDISFFRAYENGRPAKTPDYLRFSTAGAQAGELVLVAGHPASTSRLLTVAELAEVRDQTLPLRLSWAKQMEVLLSNWSARSEENARRAADLLHGIQNGRKARNGRLAGLLDPNLFAEKRRTEAEFKARLQGKPQFSEALAAYDKIAESVRVGSREAKRTLFLETWMGSMSDSFAIARTLLRAAEERAKPSGERLHEFSDASRESLELKLFSAQPIYPDLEALLLSEVLTLMASEFGAEDPLVLQALAGKSPQARAAELVQGTRVAEVGFRKHLYDGGMEAIRTAKDPLLELAQALDPEARRLRKAAEEEAEVRQQAHAAIAAARNALLGTSGYPDATYSLRLSFGTVIGYEENGQTVPAFTTLEGLYARAAAMHRQPPFDLPPLWEKRKGSLDLRTHFNFVSTADIIGGNSGSPVVDRSGRFVGIIFDGNLASLPWDYMFSQTQGRAISVDASAIVHALDRVYGARELLRELSR